MIWSDIEKMTESAPDQTREDKHQADIYIRTKSYIIWSEAEIFFPNTCWNLLKVASNNKPLKLILAYIFPSHPLLFELSASQ